MLSLEDGDTSITAHILEETYYDQNGIWISHFVTKKGHEKIVYLTYE